MLTKDHDTNDRAGDVLVVKAIGKTRYRTPDGYLYCEGVKIASTKPLLYRGEEMRNVKPQFGMVLMNRDADVLFSEETIASFQGKPITNSHPPQLVNPKTWKEKSVGVVLNPRRGEGIVDGDFLIADFLITDEKTIKEIEDKKVEVSCGYDQDHEQLKPGLGRFTRITGNHVALVERGRCGAACAIGDEETTMANQTKRSVFDRLRTAFKANDEAAFDEELKAVKDAAENDAQHLIIEVNPETHKAGVQAVADEVDPLTKLQASFDALNARLDALEGKAGDNKGKSPEECEEEEKKKAAKKKAEDEAAAKAADEAKAAADKSTMDAMTIATLRLDFQDVVGKAEILSPGINIPTFDATANSKETIADQMCGLRKSALQRALGDTKRKQIVESVIGKNVTVDGLSCDQLTLAFNAATEVARLTNNTSKVSFDHANFRQGPMTAARMQELNESYRKRPMQ